MAVHLSLSMLGALQVELDGRPVTGFESNKVRGLLAYLSVEANRSHRREALATLLWPEFPDRAALSNLRYALSNLRKAIGDRDSASPFLLVDNQTIRFNTAADCSLDVRDLVDGFASGDTESLVRAVSLYRGPFLEGFAVAGSAEFEDWVVMKREQLVRLMLQTLALLAGHHERCGEYEQAEAYARREVELEPWREQGHRRLMRALALQGRRAAALAQYETCRRLLAEGLGVEPSAETVALYQSIVDEKLAAPIPPPAPPAFLDPRARPAAEQPSAFVAREAELAKLDGYLSETLAGRGRVVFITGEPGSGKTMLHQEFSRRAQTAYPELIVAGGNCNAYTGIGDPYLPFLEMLQMLAADVEIRWAAGAFAGEHARRLWRSMPDVVDALVDDAPELIDRFLPGAGLLARARIGAPASVARLEALLKAKAAAPGQALPQQSDLFEQFTKVLQRLARGRPLLLIVDDLQWADAGSIGLLFHLGKRLPGHRILLLGAYRPGEVSSGRDGKRHPLEPVINELQRDYGDNQVDLSKAESHAWLDALLEREPNRLGESFRTTLFRHTNGHALFTVELLHGLQERGDLVRDEAGCWIEGSHLDWDTLPPRVEAVIAESMSRLPPADQSILVAGSVEGEVFTAEAVARVTGLDGHEVVRRLGGHLGQEQRLVAPAGVQRLNGGRLDSGQFESYLISRYRFRHFLFQKYLYGRMDEAERMHVHETMGWALEALYGAETGEMAAELARHFEVARLAGKAVQYLHLAGDRATRLSANPEAIAYYEHAIDLLQSLPDTPERRANELRLRVALGVPLLALSGYTSPEIEANYRRAHDLTRGMPPSPELFWTIFGIQTYYNLRLVLAEARSMGDELLALAARLEDDRLLLVASQARSITALYEGDFDNYQHHAEQVARLYDRRRDGDIGYLAGLDIEVARLGHAAWACWTMGYPDQARRHVQAACGWADEIKHPFSTGFAYSLGNKVYMDIRDFRQADQLQNQARSVCEQYGIAVWSATTLSGSGSGLLAQGRPAEGVRLLEQAHAILRHMGSQLLVFMILPDVIVGYARVGRVAEALGLAEEGLEFATSMGYRLSVPDLYLARAVALRADERSERAAEAEVSIQQALGLAREMGAKSWELRAALELARLWHQQGKDEDAYRLLVPVYSWFTEGFDTPDLVEARLLLHELTAK